MDRNHLMEFVRESNRIEGITREPTLFELLAHEDFIALPQITLTALQTLVHVLQPGARLRSRPGDDVIVGGHVPPAGGPFVREHLQMCLDYWIKHMTPYKFHLEYENLHPFTDGNGRSGRAIWLWQMVKRGDSVPLGFLHTFYYQALAAGDERAA